MMKTAQQTSYSVHEGYIRTDSKLILTLPIPIQPADPILSI